MRWVLATAMIVCVACDGVIDDPAAGPGGPGGPGTGALDCADPPEVGAPVPMRRLTAKQLEATIADVLMERVSYPISDEQLLGYRANTSSGLDTSSARTVMTTSEAIAEAIAPGLLADPRCATDCAGLVLDEIAPRLFRRPLDAPTRARFEALYDAGVATEGPDAGVRWLVSGLLQSPRFLYVLEATDASGRLDGWSIASRLSYSLWGGPPDDELLAAAADGALADAAGIAAQAERMIDDPRFERGLEEFVVQWLSLEDLDDPAARPDYAALDPATQRALRSEPIAMIAEHIRLGASMAELLTSRETPADPALDAIYGADVVSVEGETAQLDPARRAGLLTLPGVLAALSHAEETSPTLRGRAVLANLLCRPPPPPPAGVVTTLPPAMPGATTRERLEAHFSDPACSSCHAAMDGIGFAFESYDWLGRWRDEEHGRAIDTTASFTIDEDTVSVTGATDLAAVLGARRDVAECFARHYSRYAVGVRETADFDCTVETLADEALGPRGLRGMVIAYVTSAWFVEPGIPMGGEE